MAGVATVESGAGSSIGGVSSERQYQSGEALAEWRSSEQVENGITSISAPYWDSDDDGNGGLKPSQLYGKFTWNIEKFSQNTKRELRSNVFEIGGYKWYILIYPQGCDVCNHLSLFLCVANHDKLLPGWSHFAQFTIAVVNKDPKKSKYSDTLHRFWKKEHDWGWKKFMELSKVMDGFIDADSLIIKAQVQVIRERADRPFRCLDSRYWRELVRVYLINVDQMCRNYIEERQAKLGKLIKDQATWSSFCSFWMGMDQSSRRRMARAKTELILKDVVKEFFVEKEVTSTLVMDSLYSGLRVLEGQNKGKKSKGKYLEAQELSVPIVRVEKDAFVLVDDVLLMLERAAVEPLPPKDDKGPQNRTKDGVGEELNKDSIELDERRLTELGRRTIEIFVLTHIFSNIDVSYKEAVSLRKQEELIREEASEQKAKREADKEKKSKKKQGKQKKNNKKGKDKGRDDKSSSIVQDTKEQEQYDSPTSETKDSLPAEQEIVLEKPDAAEDISDVSDCLPEIPPPDSEDTDTPLEAARSAIHGFSGVQNGTEVRSPSLVDDSSSTCSSDSVPSVVFSVPHKANSQHHKNPKSPNRGKNHQSKLTSEKAGRVNGEVSQPSNDASRSSKTVGSLSQTAVRPLQDRVVNGHVGKKEEETGFLHRNSSAKNVVEVKVPVNKAARIIMSPPKTTIPSITSPPKEETVFLHRNSSAKNVVDVKLPGNTYNPKSESKVKPAIEPVLVVKKAPSVSPVPKRSDTSILLPNSAQNGPTLKPEPRKLPTPKPAEKPSVIEKKPPAQQVPVMSRPLSAPIAPGPTKPAVSSMVSNMVQSATPVLARSASAAGRLGPTEPPTPPPTQSYNIPQSYRNAIMGSGPGPTYHPASSASPHSYSQGPGPAFLDPNSLMNPTNLSFGVVNNHHQHNHNHNLIHNHHDMMQQNVPTWMERAPPLPPQRGDLGHFPSDLPAGTSAPDEFPHLDIINDLLDDENVQSFDNGPYYSGLGPSMTCRFERTRSYQDDVGYHHHQHGGYGASGSFYDDAVRDMSGGRPYGQVDGFMPNPNLWQMGGGSDLPPYLSVGNMESNNNNNGGYPYHHMPEYANFSVGVNGYTPFRPSNGL